MSGFRLGVEIELMAPRGRTRRDLADAVATARGGEVRPAFHLDSEPSKVPGSPVFHNLTPGFEVYDTSGFVLRVTDDLTLQDDLVRGAPPRPGWFRIVSDDVRMLRLARRHLDPRAPIEHVLDPLGALFGSEPELLPSGVVRLADPWGSSLALAAPLPGERERPCEIALAPTVGGELMDQVLAIARELGFTAPAEGAVHLHADRGPLESASALRQLVHLLDGREADLHRVLRTNPRCRRLAPWPAALRSAVDQPGFASLSWAQALEHLRPLRLSKWVDLNLRNLVHDIPGKPTVEWRILPVSLEARPILAAARLFEAILARAADPKPVTTQGLDQWLEDLPLGDDRQHWLRAWAGSR